MKNTFLCWEIGPGQLWVRVEERDEDGRVIHTWLGQALKFGGRRWTRDGNIRAPKAIVEQLEAAAEEGILDVVYGGFAEAKKHGDYLRENPQIRESLFG
ncbi:MAG: hypothetical protein ACOZBH_02290 [Patescibacteria group bacterium]